MPWFLPHPREQCQQSCEVYIRILFISWLMYDLRQLRYVYQFGCFIIPKVLVFHSRVI